MLVVGLCGAASAAAQDIGFLSDYSLLEVRERDIANRVYVVPNVEEKMKGFNAFLIDQPEIFISAIKPGQRCAGRARIRNGLKP